MTVEPAIVGALLILSLGLNISLAIAWWADHRAAVSYRAGWVSCLTGWEDTLTMIQAAAAEATETAEAIALARAMSYGPRPTPPSSTSPN